jgi:hypothetical protein
MKNIFIYFFCFLLFFFSACKKYQTQFEGPKRTYPNIPLPIVYVQAGEVKCTEPTLTYFRTLPLPAFARYASINPSGDRIAYKTSTGSISVVDTTGKLIEIIANTTAVTCFDWCANNQTLYYLDNQTLKFSGAAVTVALTDFSTIFPASSTNRKVFAVNIKPDGSVLFIYEYYTGFTTKRILKLDNITGADQERPLAVTTYPVRWLKASTSGADIYFGGLDAVASVNKIFKTTLTSTDVEQTVPSTSFAAPSPDNIYTATLSTSSGLTIKSAAKSVNLPFSGGTDLDW